MTDKIKTVPIRKTVDLIRNLEPFNTYGNMRGSIEQGLDEYHTYGNGYAMTGYDLAVFMQQCRDIEYAVWSWAMPIAWWSERHGWHVVRQSFSSFTGRHQSPVRQAVPGSLSYWSAWFEIVPAPHGETLACRRTRGKHVGPVGYTDDGTLCERHYLMRPKVARDPLARLALTNLMAEAQS